MDQSVIGSVITSKVCDNNTMVSTATFISMLKSVSGISLSHCLLSCDRHSLPLSTVYTLQNYLMIMTK